MNNKGLSLLVLASALLSTSAAAETILGLREADGRLISFDSATPGVIISDVALTGFPAGVLPMGLDFHAPGNQLYVVGRGPVNECQLYKLARTGAVTPVGSNRFDCGGVLEDIDINPVNGNVRLMGGNKVLDVNIDGAVIQLPDETARRRADSAYPASGDANSGQMPDIRATAYTNHTAPAPATANLFAVDAARKSLVGVGPDRSPVEGPTALTTIGSLGAGGGALDISGTTGTAYMFDFDFGAGVTLHGNLYTVNTTTGVATIVGKIGTDSLNLLGMTVVPPPSDDSSGGGAFTGLLLVLLGGLRSRRLLACYLRAA
jgi:hypothetical protein